MNFQRISVQPARGLPGATRRLQRQGGISLVELLIAMALAVVLLSIAVPAFTGFQARRATDAALAALSHDLALARAEAIRRGNSVTICGSDDGTTCSGQNDWRGGWLLYDRRAAASAPASAASVVLRVQGPLQGIASLAVNLGILTRITFGPTGIGAGANGNIQVTPTADPQGMRMLCLSLGRDMLRPSGAQAC